MLTRFRSWRESLPPLQQVVILFLFYWVYWFAASFVLAKFFGSQDETMLYRVLSAAWMALVFVAVFHWKWVKAAFRRRGADDAA